MFRFSINRAGLLALSVATVTIIRGVAHAQNRKSAHKRLDTVQNQSPAMQLSLDFSRDGSMLVTGGDAVRVYDVESKELLHVSMKASVEKHSRHVEGAMIESTTLSPLTRTVAFSPTDNDLFVAAGDDGVIRLCQVSKQEPVLVLKGHSYRVSSVAFSPDGALIASSAARTSMSKRAMGELKIWNTKTGKELQSITFPGSAVSCVAFSDNGNFLAISSSRKAGKEEVASEIVVYDVASWKRMKKIPFTPGFALSILFAGNERQLIITGGVCIPLSETSCRPTGKLWFADLTSDETPIPLKVEQCDYFRSASLASSGDHFATGTSIQRDQLDKMGQKIGHARVSEIQMRKTDTGEILWRHDEKMSEPYGVTLSPNGKLVGYCVNNWIIMLNADSGALVTSINVEENPAAEL